MTERQFPHHEEVLSVLRILMETWAIAEPKSPMALYPASYQESFLDMARAVVEARYEGQ